MERVELLGANFSIKYGDRKICPIDPWIPMIILIQVWLWPVNVKTCETKSAFSAEGKKKRLRSTYFDQVLPMN